MTEANTTSNQNEISHYNYVSCDYFTLFSLPKKYSILKKDLLDKYESLQMEFHPDRHIGKPDFDKKLYANLSSRVNDGYAILSDPLLRSIYFLSLNGIDVFSYGQHMVPSEFIMKQIELREQAEQADEENKKHIIDALEVKMKKLEIKTESHLLLEEWQSAAITICCWHYLQKAKDDISTSII